jgi:hypothetical protein
LTGFEKLKVSGTFKPKSGPDFGLRNLPGCQGSYITFWAMILI